MSSGVEQSRDFVERFAQALTDMGMPRMSARVLALFVCTDARELSAPDIVERLSVSPAAVSGALRTLVQAGLVAWTPTPGNRRDHYRLQGDAWTGAAAIKQERFTALADLAGQGLAAVPPDGPAAERLGGMRDFYLFLAAEMPALIDRWNSRRGTGSA